MNKEIDYRSITRDLLIKESRFPLSIVPTEQDLLSHGSLICTMKLQPATN